MDRESILEALLHRSSFNLTHHATGINIDIFIPKVVLMTNNAFSVRNGSNFRAWINRLLWRHQKILC